MLLYLVVYAVATLGTFSALACLAEGNRPIDRIDDLAGLAWTPGARRKTLAWALAAFMFSLTGIPPLAGFWGKLLVFGSALGVDHLPADLRNRFLLLAVIGVINAAFSAGYYLRVVGVIFFREPGSPPRVEESTGLTFVSAVLCLLLALGIGLSPGRWIDHARAAASPSPSPFALRK